MIRLTNWERSDLLSIRSKNRLFRGLTQTTPTHKDLSLHGIASVPGASDGKEEDFF